MKKSYFVLFYKSGKLFSRRPSGRKLCEDYFKIGLGVFQEEYEEAKSDSEKAHDEFFWEQEGALIATLRDHEITNKASAVKKLEQKENALKDARQDVVVATSTKKNL